MTTEVDNQIRDRFFEAIAFLVASKQLRGKKTFCAEYNINRGTFYRVEKGEYAFSSPCWLTYLVRDYNISPAWLLTGFGKMLAK